MIISQGGKRHRYSSSDEEEDVLVAHRQAKRRRLGSPTQQSPTLHSLLELRRGSSSDLHSQHDHVSSMVAQAVAPNPGASPLSSGGEILPHGTSAHASPMVARTLALCRQFDGFSPGVVQAATNLMMME